MKKNKSNLLIPVLVIVVLIIILGYILLKDSLSDLFKANKNQLVRIEGFPREVDSAKQIDKSRTIVKSEQEFKDLMKKMFDDENKIPVPQNDFSQNDLYVVATELNDTKGYRLKIRTIYRNETNNEYEAQLERQKPGKNCMFEEVTNVALDIVKVDKNIPEIEAERVDKIIDCE